MKSISLQLLLVLVVVLQVWANDALYDKHHVDCADELKIAEDVDLDILAATQPHKCFQKCVLQKFGVVSGQQLHPDKIKDVFPEFIAEDVKFFKDCCKKNKNVADICEKTTKIMECSVELFGEEEK